MSNYDEKLVFTDRLESIRRDILGRLLPNSPREIGKSGGPDDGKYPFNDAFDRYPDESYVIAYAHGIVESWLVSAPRIFDHDILVGFPRPTRGVYEHFSWGLSGEGRWEATEQMARLRARMPDTGDFVDMRGRARMGKEAYDNIDSLWWAGGYQGHTVPSYPKLLTMGLGGIMEQIDHYAALVPEGYKPQEEFYEACRIIIRGLSDYLLLYADYAAKLASETDDEVKKAELLENERICRKVSWDKPETMLEAAQLMWTYCLWDWVDCVGRFDQYMLPFYTGSDEDKEIISALVFKFWEHGVHNVTISGVKPEDGSDATNEITYLVLQTLRNIHDTHPRVSVRVHDNTPKELLDLVVKIWSEGMSDPTLASDKNAIEGLTHFGVPLEKARNYSILGCQEIEIPGESNFGCEDGSINLAKILEFVLNHGRDRFNGIKMTADLGNITTYETFDDLWNAYDRTVSSLVYIYLDLCNEGQRARAINVAKLVKSPLTEACIERGVNLDDGGARFNYGVIETAGMAAVADALYAIKTLVYEQGKISREDLEAAIAANFEGYEHIRQLLLHAPKFGNDHEGADEMAVKVLTHFWTEIGKYKSVRGQEFMGACSLLGGGVEYGNGTWAMADGRFAGEPLGNTMGPRTGSDKKGLTAMLKSVAKLPLKLGVGGTTLNVLIPQATLETPEMRDDIASLMKTYMLSGGQLAQITTANLEDMLDAVDHPENHGDLIVRIGGFSYKFVELGREEQLEMIARYSEEC